jgi:hypothetical protein
MNDVKATRLLPDIPSVMNGGAFIPSPLTVQAFLMACSNAQEGATQWVPDEGIPTYVYKKPAGVSLIQVRPDDPNVEPDEITVNDLWRKVRELSDLDGDVLLVMLAQTLGTPPDEKGFVWITSKRILEYRDIKPITKPTNKAPRRAGDRQEDLARIAECVEHLENIWISVRQWIEEGKGDGGRRKRKKSKRLYKHESRLIAVIDTINQYELDGITQITSPTRRLSLTLAWRYQIGSWLEPFLRAPNRQVAWLLQQVLHYDPYHEKWEKRLARYFTFHLRINASKSHKSITRTVGTLIDELSLPTDRRHPERTRQSFQSAMERLRDDGQISSWKYQEDITQLPSSRWLETWRAYHIEVTAEPITFRR